MAVFYAACSLSGAFGGLLAFAIEKMDGISGVNGWQWIFIIEGLFTVACALPVWFYLPDGPDTAKFLTDTEKHFVANRLNNDESAGKVPMTNNEKLRWSHVKSAFADWKIWALMVIYSGVSIGVYGFTSILPTIVNGLGYTSATAQLMTIPVRTTQSIITITDPIIASRL
jgi:sugar phosphate permease